MSRFSIKRPDIYIEEIKSNPKSIEGIGIVIVRDGELSEHIAQTVIPEAKEETCLDITNPQLIDVVDTVDLDPDGKVKHQYVIFDYLVKVVGDEIAAASDAEELRWGRLLKWRIMC